MASASADESIRIWADCDSDVIGRGDGDWLSQAILTGHSGIVWQVAWSASDLLLSVSEDGTARIWKPSSSSLLSTSWACLQSINITTRPCYCISLASDFVNQCIMAAIGTGENSIVLLSIFMKNSVLTIDKVHTIPSAHSQDVNSVVWLASGLLLSASDDALVKLWKITSVIGANGNINE